MDAPLLLGAFVAGLLGSPHCALMCGPFASACARPASGLSAWHAGRLTAYALLGAAAGAAGGVLPGPSWVPSLLAALFLGWFAAGLAGIAPEPRFVFPGLTRIGPLLQPGRGAGIRYIFGLANGFVPCGLVYAALSLPAALAAPLPGALAMLAFGAGTVPLLSIVAINLRRATPASRAARRGLAVVILTIGLWSIGARSGIFGGGVHSAPSGHHGRADTPR